MGIRGEGLPSQKRFMLIRLSFLQYKAFMQDSKDASFQTFGKKQLVSCSSKAVRSPEFPPPVEGSAHHSPARREEQCLSHACGLWRTQDQGCLLAGLASLSPFALPPNHFSAVLWAWEGWSLTIITWAALPSTSCCEQPMGIAQEPGSGREVRVFLLCPSLRWQRIDDRPLWDCSPAFIALCSGPWVVWLLMFLVSGGWYI